MPLPIQQGEVALALARQFGIQGKYSMQLDDVVVPVVTIQEEPFLDRPAAYTVTTAGSGGGHGTVDFLSPGDDRTIIVLDRVQVVPFGAVPFPANGVGLYITPSGTPSQGPGLWRDTGIGGFPSAGLATTNVPQFGFNPALVLTDSEIWVDVGIILAANPQTAGAVHAVELQALDPDTAFSVNLLWRELTPRRSNAPT